MWSPLLSGPFFLPADWKCCPLLLRIHTHTHTLHKHTFYVSEKENFLQRGWRIWVNHLQMCFHCQWVCQVQTVKNMKNNKDPVQLVLHCRPWQPNLLGFLFFFPFRTATVVEISKRCFCCWLARRTQKHWIAFFKGAKHWSFAGFLLICALLLLFLLSILGCFDFQMVRTLQNLSVSFAMLLNRKWLTDRWSNPTVPPTKLRTHPIQYVFPSLSQFAKFLLRLKPVMPNIFFL